MSRLTMYTENEQSRESVNELLLAQVRSAISATLDFEGIDQACEVSVTFTDNEQIRRLNAQYRGIDSATDVLSFPLEDFEDEDYDCEDSDPDGEEECEIPLMLGDIVLSLERAREQADTYGHSFEREVAFLCVHSTLHLLGYDHETADEDEMDMRVRQRKILESIGLSVSGDVK